LDLLNIKKEENKELLEEKKNDLKDLMKNADKKAEEMNIEKIKKASRISKFLQKIGWDLIPEDARKIIIKELNNGLYLAK
jgi:fructose-1,6-bisphosphatase/inositol monophosphatase family enzyme